MDQPGVRTSMETSLKSNDETEVQGVVAIQQYRAEPTYSFFISATSVS
jgi:hypothetical protein